MLCQFSRHRHRERANEDARDKRPSEYRLYQGLWCILCISKAELKKKPINLILAATFGKQIVTEYWLLESAAQSQLLDPEYLLARTNSERGRECDIDLSETVHRTKAGVKPLLGYFLFFTPAAVNQIGIGEPFSRLETLGLAPGCQKYRTTHFDLRAK